MELLTSNACLGCHGIDGAVVKADGHLREKVAFVTASPCVMCAKLLIQANVTHVFYRQPYRKPDGLDTLRRGGVKTIHYVKWKDSWR